MKQLDCAVIIFAPKAVAALTMRIIQRTPEVGLADVLRLAGIPIEQGRCTPI
jgi:hypothetical protein